MNNHGKQNVNIKSPFGKWCDEAFSLNADNPIKGFEVV